MQSEDPAVLDASEQLRKTVGYRHGSSPLQLRKSPSIERLQGENSYSSSSSSSSSLSSLPSSVDVAKARKKNSRSKRRALNLSISGIPYGCSQSTAEEAILNSKGWRKWAVRWIAYDTNFVVAFQKLFGVGWTDPRSEYTVGNWFVHLVFSIGAALGNEAFYILFLPMVAWYGNLMVARRVAMLWVSLYYIGQLLKDLLKLPRPFSPPAVQIERHYADEYGMPSTHAMCAVSFPFYLAFLMAGAPPAFSIFATSIQFLSSQAASVFLHGLLRVIENLPHWELLRCISVHSILTILTLGSTSITETSAKNILSAQHNTLASVFSLSQIHQLEQCDMSTVAHLVVQVIHNLAAQQQNLQKVLTDNHCSAWQVVMWISAIVWCLIMTFSRLYMGVHTLLDLSSGIILGLLILFGVHYSGDYVDRWLIGGDNVAFWAIFLTIMMALMYYVIARPDKWTHAYGDTCIVISVGMIGLMVGTRFLLNAPIPPGPTQDAILSGVIFDHKVLNPVHKAFNWTLLAPSAENSFSIPRITGPDLPLFVDFAPATYSFGAWILLRALSGYFLLFVTRAVVKEVMWFVMLRLFPAPPGCSAPRERYIVEIPVKLATYGTVGFNAVYTCFFLFDYLGL